MKMHHVWTGKVFVSSFITGNQHCTYETKEVVLIVVKHIDNRINEGLLFFPPFSAQKFQGFSKVFFSFFLFLSLIFFGVPLMTPRIWEWRTSSCWLEMALRSWNLTGGNISPEEENIMHFKDLASGEKFKPRENLSALLGRMGWTIFFNSTGYLSAMLSLISAACSVLLISSWCTAW